MRIASLANKEIVKVVSREIKYRMPGIRDYEIEKLLSELTIIDDLTNIKDIRKA